MAGLEGDVSSFNQPLPVSPLEKMGKLQALEQQSISIDKSKLDLMNTQFGLMNAELSGMIDDPTITKEQAAQRLNRFADTYKLPPEARNHMMQELNEAPSVKAFSERALRRGMDTQQRINQQYGTPETQNDAATIYQGNRDVRTGAFKPGSTLPVQLPPTTEDVDNRRMINGKPNPNYLQRGYLGPSGPPGVQPVAPMGRGSLPVTPLQQAAPAPSVAAGAPMVPKPVRSLPVEKPTTGPTGPTTQTGFDFNQRFNGERVVTGAAPGVASAIESVGKKSGEDYATDLTRAKNFKAELYPAQAALEGIKELGPQNVGPGTEALNNVKSAIITWLPNVDQKVIDNVATFEQTRKYLTQIARASGSTGTNDQLAASFEANPSIKMSGAATENVLKSVIALRKMQHAQTLLFGQQNLPQNEYSKWIAENQNTLDPRAFGFDMMDSRAKTKLVDQLKKDPKAYQKFETSLQFAHDADLIEPPARK